MKVKSLTLLGKLGARPEIQQPFPGPGSQTLNKNTGGDDAIANGSFRDSDISLAITRNYSSND